jgi:hypothetical protein
VILFSPTSCNVLNKVVELIRVDLLIILISSGKVPLSLHQYQSTWVL